MSHLNVFFSLMNCSLLFNQSCFIWASFPTHLTSKCASLHNLMKNSYWISLGCLPCLFFRFNLIDAHPVYQRRKWLVSVAFHCFEKWFLGRAIWNFVIILFFSNKICISDYLGTKTWREESILHTLVQSKVLCSPWVFRALK